MQTDSDEIETKYDTLKSENALSSVNEVAALFCLHLFLINF